MNRVVLISGGGSGVGRAAAEEFCARGWRVYGTSRRAQWPREHPKEGAHPAHPHGRAEEESVRAAVEAVWRWEGRLDAVLCNAGMGVAGPLELLTQEEAALQLQTNLDGALRTARIALPYLRGQGGGPDYRHQLSGGPYPASLSGPLQRGQGGAGDLLSGPRNGGTAPSISRPAAWSWGIPAQTLQETADTVRATAGDTGTTAPALRGVSTGWRRTSATECPPKRRRAAWSGRLSAGI